MHDNQLLLAFYGDDFTGSTDAMEALAINNYRTVLFLDAPSSEMLEQFCNEEVGDGVTLTCLARYWMYQELKAN